MCECSSGYSSSDCSLTEEELQAKVIMRSALMSQLAVLTQSENVEAETLTSWTNSMSSLTQNSDEISESSIGLIMDISTSILGSAGGLTILKAL